VAQPIYEFLGGVFAVDVHVIENSTYPKFVTLRVTSLSHSIGDQDKRLLRLEG
jgi:hypothetical protein